MGDTGGFQQFLKRLNDVNNQFAQIRARLADTTAVLENRVQRLRGGKATIPMVARTDRIGSSQTVAGR